MNRDSDYHVSTTMMPDGSIYAGEHDSQNGYPTGPLIASLIKNKAGLKAKTIINQKLGALSASIQNARFGGQLKAAITVADKVNIAHLQMIRLLPELQGLPDDYFWLDEMFTVRDVPMLEGRETFYDTTATAEYKGRLEETRATKTAYDEIKYDLLKLSDKAFTPIEDLMRTIINPQNVDVGQINYGFKFKRNQSALKALKDIGNTQSTIAAFDTIGATDFHHTNHSANTINDLLNTFLKANDVKITHIAINTTTFQEYTENTWTKSGPLDLNPIRSHGGGVMPFP